jgi:hypothetical protein
MSFRPRTIEQAILENIASNLEAEGFQVYVRPSRGTLPSFMHGYEPDAIALQANKKRVIEIVSDSPAGEQKLHRLRALLSDHPEWELMVFYAPSRNPEPPIGKFSSKAELEAILGVLPKITEDAGPVPALLTAWAAFEAAARLLIPNKLDRPQPPSRLVEILASDGYITPSEADKIRQLGISRNRAAHGSFDIVLTSAELAEFIEIVQTLLDLSPKPRRRTPQTSDT